MKALEALDAPATFFMTGEQVRAHPDESTRRLTGGEIVVLHDADRGLRLSLIH